MVPAPVFVRPKEAEFEGLAAADTAELCRRMTGRLDLSAAEPAPAPPPSTVAEAPEPRVGTVSADLERVATGGMPEAGARSRRLVESVGGSESGSWNGEGRARLRRASVR
jgi:hypothetical protein